MARRCLPVLAVLLSLSTTTLSAQSGTASISGRVTDAATGQPLATQTGGMNVQVSLFTGAGSFVALIDADGRYSFTGLAAGSYAITVLASSDYVQRSSDGTPCVGSCVPVRPFVLAEGASREFDFPLERTAVIEGRVLDAQTSSPLPQSTVRLYDTRDQFLASVQVDGGGHYRFASRLAASTYYVVASQSVGLPGQLPPYPSQAYRGVVCADNTCRLADATPIRVGASQTVGGIDILIARRTGSISGRVLTAAGAPAAGIVAQAFPASGSTSSFTAAADATGFYTIPDLPDGIYYVIVRPDAAPNAGPYVPQIYPGIDTARCRFGDCGDDARTGSPVIVTAGAPTTGINFSLSAPGGFSGRLLQNGAGVSSGVIEVFDANSASTWAALRTLQTNSTGAYSLGDLPPGNYFARGRNLSTEALYGGAPCVPGACSAALGAPIAVTAGAVTTGIDMTLPANGATIGGRVTAPGRASLQFISVYLKQGGVQYLASTDGEGRYTHPGVTAGTYRLCVETADFLPECYPSPLTVATDAALTGIDVELDPAATITGSITTIGPLSIGALVVEAVRGDGTVAATAFQSQSYTLRGLAAGTYFVRASSIALNLKGFAFGGDVAPVLYRDKPCPTHHCDVAGGTPVTVPAGGSATGIDLTIRQGASITGRVRVEGRAISIESFSFPGLVAGKFLRVQAYAEDGRPAGNFIRGFGGAYTIHGLAAGRYYLKASVDGYAEQLYKDLACGDCPPEQGTPVIVAEGARRTDIDFVLLPEGSITGTVRAADGSPLPRVRVSAYGAGGTLVTTVETNRAGGFAMANLTAGRYFVGTFNDQGYADEVYDDVACGTCDPARGQAVDVSGGSLTSGIDFTLARGALVNGIVNDSEGAPAGSSVVQFFSASGPVARVTASFVGGYTVSVPAGTLYARVDPRAGFGAQLYSNQPCPGGVCDPTTGTPIASSAGQIIRGIDFSVPVCGTIALQPSALPVGAVGSTYSASVVASGSGPYSYSVTAGRLAPGLVIDASSGALSGTPTAAGRYTVTIGAAAANGCGAVAIYTIDVTSCTPAIGVNSFGVATFDAIGAGTVITETLDGACAVPILFNVAWLTKGRDLGAGLLEIVVAPNPAGRRTGTITIGNRTVTVNQGAATSVTPIGSFDLPLDGAAVAGSVAIGGWALDDLRVAAVRLYRAPGPGRTDDVVFIGDATLVPGARPDVEGAYPEYPYGNRAGWGYLLLTNMLPNQGNGTFHILAIVEDVEGHQVSLGTRAIVANNASSTQPFGAIDTPGQGETIGGASYVNFGWALTPQPKTIPKDGSKITVFVDSAPVGTISYNHSRADIAALFPGFNNSTGPVGFRMLDTTTLADGVHTIAWVVEDDAGAVEGIGSRYFTVQNGAATSGSLTGPVLLRTAPAQATTRAIEVRQLERITIELFDSADAACSTVVSGVERVGREQRALPVGSTLDREAGVFRWQPGPGFIGTYTLSFDVGQCDGSLVRVDVAITIKSE